MVQVIVKIYISSQFSFLLLARERIARSSGKSVDDVGKLLYFYKQTKIVATWLQLKKSKKEKIPEVFIIIIITIIIITFLFFVDSRRNATNARD